MTTTVERVRALVEPLVAEADLSLYDLDLGGGVLSVLVDAPGGADIDAISRLARSISRALSDCKLLVLRQKFMEELVRNDPEAACQILLNVSRIMAERMGGMVRAEAIAAEADV